MQGCQVPTRAAGSLHWFELFLGHTGEQGLAGASSHASIPSQRRHLELRERRSACSYSTAENSAIAIASITRPMMPTMAASKRLGTCQPHQVTPGASA